MISLVGGVTWHAMMLFSMWRCSPDMGLHGALALSGLFSFDDVGSLQSLNDVGRLSVSCCLCSSIFFVRFNLYTLGE